VKAVTLKIDDLAPKMEITGVVKRIELAGAFLDIGIGHEALLHISQMKPSNIRNVRDVLTEGQELTLWIQVVDPANFRVSLTMNKPVALDWDEIKDGNEYDGKVVKVEKYGVFVDIGAERPGLIHVSELSTDYVKSPSDIVKKDDEIRVKVLRVNRGKSQIDLSRKALMVEPSRQVEIEDEEEEAPITAMALALQRAMSSEKSSAADEKLEKKRTADRAKQDEILRRTLENQINQ
jgi:ribosomal protein S1